MLRKLLDNQLPLKLRFRRFEFKYCLPDSLALRILDDLTDFMDWDPYVKDQPEKFYQVSSLYFDTANFDCYHEKLSGIKDRKKLRLRTYAVEVGPKTPVFMEIKRKSDMVILKDRLVTDYQHCFDFVDKGQAHQLIAHLSPPEQELFKEFFWLKTHNCLLPKIMVVYKRQPLFSKIDPGFRITFDSQIRAYPARHLSFSEEAAEVFKDGTVMELKYNNTIPAWFHQIVVKYQLNRQAFSKYANSLETCRNHYQHV